MIKSPAYYTDLFATLGQIMGKVSQALLQQSPVPDGGHQLYRAALQSANDNPWFTTRETARALQALSGMLTFGALRDWMQSYPRLSTGNRQVKKVGVIMAGNIPLVGFHDMLCVITAGHQLLLKPSSNDKLLPLAVANTLALLDKGLMNRIRVTGEMKDEAQAMIATGSDNTARYFTYHYGHLPHIIRKNRYSAAILTGRESVRELESLGEDVFAYYGMGCRNVSYLFIPGVEHLGHLTRAWKAYSYVLENRAYTNNLRHGRALMKVCGKAYSDAGFCLFAENRQPGSSPAVLHYSTWQDAGELWDQVRDRRHQLQCIVTARPEQWPDPGLLTPGSTQEPSLPDYADGTDTMDFLLSL